MSGTPRNWMAWTALIAGALVLIAPAVIVGTIGVPYYLTAEAVRTDHWLHPWYGPGKGAGLLMGLIGTVLLLTMLFYSMRKWLGPPMLGDTSWWLRVHVVSGILAPIYIILHGGFVLPTGFVAVGFWCMILVVVSGMFGMWVFPLLPMAVQRSRAAIEREPALLSDLRARLLEANGVNASEVGRALELVRSFRGRSGSPLALIRLDVELARRRSLVRHHIEKSGLGPNLRAQATRILTGQLRLRRRAAAFQMAQRITAPWQMLHFPVSLAMYGVAFLHILLALIFGDVLRSLW